MLFRREAIALYTGRLSSLRILPECVCDTEHPFVDKTNEWQCNGYGEQQKPTNRLSFGKGAGYSFSLPEFINDGSLQTFWATRFDLQRIGVKSVSVSIDFQRQVQVNSTKSLYWRCYFTCSRSCCAHCVGIFDQSIFLVIPSVVLEYYVFKQNITQIAIIVCKG